MRRIGSLVLVAVGVLAAGRAESQQSPAPRNRAAAPAASAPGPAARGAAQPQPVARQAQPRVVDPKAQPRVVDPKARQAAAQEAAGAPAVAPANAARMEEILRLWVDRSKSTTSMYAKFTRTDEIAAWGDTIYYQGVAFLKSPNLAYLNFEKIGEDRQAKPKQDERIICTGDRIYQFLTETKQIHIYELAKDQGQRALEEGPLPFLFNMKSDEVRRRYQMRLVKEDAELAYIEIKPRENLDREAFSLAHIYLDKGEFKPTKIVLFDPSNGKDKKTYDFVYVQRNAQVKDTRPYFDGAALAQTHAKAGWDKVEYGPQGEVLNGKPRQAAGGQPVRSPQPRPVAPQPAQRAAAPRR